MYGWIFFGFIVLAFISFLADFLFDNNKIAEKMFVLLFFVGFFGAIFTPFCSPSYTKKTVDENIKIIALQDNISTEGKFFLGCGHVGSNEYFYYMINTPNGKQIKPLENSDSTYIQETDDEQPCIKKYTVSEYTKLFSILCDSREKTIIYIPEGSIKYDYKVDLK